MWDQKASYQARSVAVIEAMAARYGRRTALLGFGLLNEPIVSAAGLSWSHPLTLTRASWPRMDPVRRLKSR